MPLFWTTSTDAFLHRAQRSEQLRAMFMTGLIAVMLALAVLRQMARGAVWGSDNVEYAPPIVFALWLTYQVGVYMRVRSLNRRGLLVPGWSWRANVAIDLLFPTLLMLLSTEPTRRGEVDALSAPAVLLYPIVIVLSVLRLRPTLTLATGVGAALAHLGLLLRARELRPIGAEEYPGLLTYAIALAMTGVAGWLLARRVTGYVIEGAAEAAARERDRARLAGIERELGVAREIQAGLLPAASPALAGFEIAGMNRPADETGGDYYDWQELPDGRLAVAVADVTGHGVGPALLMAVCRAYARASTPVIPDTSALLARLNELLYPDLRGDRFITLAIAMIDRCGSVLLLSAGHGPTLLYRAKTGAIEQFAADGVPLGIDAVATYGAARCLTMEPGDVLLMLTDGLFEWRRENDGEIFGLARLHAEFKRAACERSLSAAAMLEMIDSSVRAFAAGSRQGDDVTAVVVRRL